MHFRHRIGESGVELILAESIHVNDDHDDKGTFDTGIIDSTVQEKNVTYPTDAKLLKKVIGKIKKIVATEGLPIRRSYTRRLKAIYRDLRFRNHPKNHSRELRTIAGRLLRELQRNLGDNHAYDEQINIFIRVSTRNAMTRARSTPSTSPRSSASTRTRSTRNTSSATRCQWCARWRDSSSASWHSATSMTATR